MSRTVYVNGQYLHYASAGVHVEDRGFQFGDGIYEVCEVRDGRLVDETRHMARLARSASELNFPTIPSSGAISRIMREVVRRNRVRDGMVYLQLTRGSARRDFVFPSPDTPLSLVVLARASARSAADALGAKGISIKTMPDIRWGRCDIKTVQLLAPSMAKQAAKEAGRNDAWMVDDAGFVTEGASSNAWIVDENRQLITRPADHAILRGITRSVVIDLAEKEGLKFVERPFTVEEAQNAVEAFVTSATALVMPVVKIDDVVIGNGKPGPLTTMIREEFHSVAEIAAA